jgi:2-polyprenyl-6-methoxyphenol hydroxylase-like FAD-dependent oxidoreductase
MAHFSIGSGTRNALEDATDLFRALQAHGDVQTAFSFFEQERMPASEAFQQASGQSFKWYEKLAGAMHLDPIPFAYEYMMRTGRIDREGLRNRDPAFIAAYERYETSHKAG